MAEHRDPVRVYEERKSVEKMLRPVRHVALEDVDSIVPAEEIQQTSSGRSSKLQRAHEVGRRTEEELRQLCEGLSEKILEIGRVVTSANRPQGLREHTLVALGKVGIVAAQHKAASLRQMRLRELSLDAAIAEIQHYVTDTIRELGESEAEYKVDLKAYQDDLAKMLNKLQEANPLYLKAQGTRMVLEAETTQLAGGLKEVSQIERPAMESRYEAKMQELAAAQLEETTMLATVKEASEAIPEVQKSRDSATNAIQSLHGMRQSMLEKFSNFRVVLEHATTAMKAQARMEEYESVDPAFNKAIAEITAHNVAVAGASLEVWVERCKQAAIDPVRSQELLSELLGDIADYAKGMGEIQEGVKIGSRRQVAEARR